MTHAEVKAADYVSINVKMTDLLKVGSWDFMGDYDEEGRERVDLDYDEWVKNCYVRVQSQHGRTTYEIQEHTPGKGYNCWAPLETGDDEQTINDMIQLVETGKAKWED